jgi:hypothetical protein
MNASGFPKQIMPTASLFLQGDAHAAPFFNFFLPALANVQLAYGLAACGQATTSAGTFSKARLGKI